MMTGISAGREGFLHFCHGNFDKLLVFCIGFVRSWLGSIKEHSSILVTKHYLFRLRL